MPKRHNRRRTMKGGFLEGLTSSVEGFTGSAYNTLSGWGSSAKKSLGFGDSSTSSVESSSPVTSSYGGKNKSRRMRGGYTANTPTTGLAFHSASYSGVTAKPHTMVGGKTKKRRGGKHRHSKSSKHHKH